MSPEGNIPSSSPTSLLYTGVALKLSLQDLLLPLGMARLEEFFSEIRRGSRSKVYPASDVLISTGILVSHNEIFVIWPFLRHIGNYKRVNLDDIFKFDNWESGLYDSNHSPPSVP